MNEYESLTEKEEVFELEDVSLGSESDGRGHTPQPEEEEEHAAQPVEEHATQTEQEREREQEHEQNGPQKLPPSSQPREHPRRPRPRSSPRPNPRPRNQLDLYNFKGFMFLCFGAPGVAPHWCSKFNSLLSS